MVKPLYLLVEGVDGTGKTTLCQKLKELWPSPHVSVMSFPSREGIGKLIRDTFEPATVAVAERAMLFLLTADAVDWDVAIRRAAHNGTTVICDRHPMISAFGYQIEHHAREQVRAVIDAAGFTPPDLLVLLDAPPEVTIARRAARGTQRIRYEPAADDHLRLGAHRLAWLRRYDEWAGPKLLLDASNRVPGDLARQIITYAETL